MKLKPNTYYKCIDKIGICIRIYFVDFNMRIHYRINKGIYINSIHNEYSLLSLIKNTESTLVETPYMSTALYRILYGDVPNE